MASDIRIKYSIDTEDIAKAQAEFDKLSKEEQDALGGLKKINVELGRVGETAGNTKGKLKDAFNEGKKGAKSAGEGIGSLNGLVGKFGGLVAGAFSVGAIVAFGKAALDVTGRFQSMEAVLRNTLGSDSAAQGALVRIKEIAATTPFSVEELTQSFVKLANQGFKPTNQQIIALGDLAASTGKSFDQLAEALIDAQVGEFERLKEFGVRASKQGDQVKFTFKGVETTVQNSSKAIQDYIVSLGGMEGVMGAMGSQSATLEGSVSNLGDAWDSFLLSIGDRLGPIYQAAIKVTSAFLTTLKDLFATEEGKLKERQGKSYNAYTEQYQKMSDQALKNVEQNSFNRIAIEEKETKRLEQELEKRKKDAEKARPQIIGGGSVAGMGAGSTFDPEKTFKVKEAEAALAKQKRLVTDFKAMNQSAIDALVARSDARKQAEKDAQKAADDAAAKAEKNAKKAEAALKKEYTDKKTAIELQQKLDEERIKQTVAPEGQAMAKKELEMATNLELLALAREYEQKKLDEAANTAKLLPAVIATQNQEIAAQYKTDDAALKTQREKDLKDLWTSLYDTEMQAIDKRQQDATVKLLESGLSDKDLQKSLTENEVKFNQERIDLNNSYAALGVDAAQKGNDKLIEENARKNRELKKQDEEAAQERLEIFNAAVQAGSEITNGFFNLYQQQLEQEQAALQQKYETDIKLAGDNKQKIEDINREKAAKEKEIKRKQFEANRAQAVSQVIFNTAPIIAQYLAGTLTAPLAIIAGIAAAAQIGFIMAQPVPEFAEGTKGKPFKGGKAIVGEKGTERIVTESGKVYYTPPTATLMDLPKGAQVIPNHLLSREEIAYASLSKGKGASRPNGVEGKLSEIGAILKSLPIHQINMDERGFEKYIRTEKRSTKILNNKFPAAYS